MAEIGIIASVIQIADTGLRLSIKLYTFGEIVSTADKSVISISKDVSLTSSVLKELGSLLENDAESHIFSKNAVQTADTVVKECLEVFQEMESILVKKLPSLSGQDGIRGAGGGKKSKATALLERMKWGYLQPKLQLLRSNLDRLKSTLLLMLNVITYARQVAGKSEPPSVIEDQRSLIEDLARSNQDYIRKFEQLKLGILDTPRKQEENVQSDRTGDGVELEREQNPQNRGHSRSMSPERTATANVNINNMYINANVQSISIPGEYEKAKQPPKAQVAGSERDNLFSHLKHYLSLVNNLLNEVDEIKYEIRIDSRDRVRTDICKAYQREMKQLDTSHKNTKNVLAEKQLVPLVAGVKRRLEQIEGPETEGRGRKRISPNTINNGPQQISQPQPDSDDMQFCDEEADESYSMPFNNDLNNPDLLGNFDCEQFLQSTAGYEFTFDPSAIEPKRSPRLPNLGTVESHALQNYQAQSMIFQHDLKQQSVFKARQEQDTPTGPPVGRTMLPRQQRGSLEASQQRLNPAQQLQRDLPVTIQHQQGQIHLNKVTSDEIVAAGSEFQAQQGLDKDTTASAPYANQHGFPDWVMPSQRISHAASPSLRESALNSSGYPPFGNLPLQTVPISHQQQAQQHHVEQQHIIAQLQQLQLLPQNLEAQRQQQRAYLYDFDQKYHARGNVQAQRSLSQAQSVQGEPQSSLRLQSATPLHLINAGPPQEKRVQSSIKGFKRRVCEAPAPIPSRQLSPTSVSHFQARPLPSPLRGSAHETDCFSGSKVGSGEQGISPTYDDLMQEVEATVMGIPAPSSSASNQGSMRSRKQECMETRSGGQFCNYDMYNNSGDTEAEAGFSAMQMAVEQDGKYSSGGDINANMTTYAGGSPDLAHYGNRLPPLSLEGYGYPNEVDEVGGPFTAPRSSSPPTPSGAMDVHGGLYDYQVPESGSVKPYAPARVDVTGTGGLVEAGVHPRRLSFGRNEEEATMIESPPIDLATNADQARRLKLQQEQEDPRTVSVYGTDLQGNLLSNSSANSPNTPRKPFQEKERSVNPMSGSKVNKNGEIRGGDDELLGMLTDGHLPDLVGLEVDDNGYVLDTEGNRAGECTLIQNVKKDEGPTEEETMAAHNAGFTKKMNLNDTKHKHARRRPRGPGGRFLTAVEAWLNKKGQRKQEQVLQSAADSRPQSPPIQGRGPDVDIMPTEKNDPPVIPRQSLINPLPPSPEGGGFQRYAADTAGSQISEPETSHEGRRSITAGVALKRRDNPLPDINVEDPTDTVPVKRARNTLAARKSREKRMERAEALANQINELEAEVEYWKMIGKPNSVGLAADDDDVPVAKKRKMAPKKTLGGESEKSKDNDKGISDAGHSVYHGRDSTKTMPPGFGSSVDGSSQLPKEEESTPIDRGTQLVLPTIEGDRRPVRCLVSVEPPRLESESDGMRPPERRESRSLQRRLRSSTSTLSNRDYILGTADPSRSLASGPDKRVHKSPATLQCTLCPKKFTRAYLLRSHLRTHHDECAASAADRDRSQKDQSGSRDALMDNGPQPRDQHECEAGINSNSGQIRDSHVASQNIPSPPKDETYVAGRQQRTSELSTINAKVLNEDSKHSELSGDEGAKPAVDDMDIELNLDASTVTADVSGAHPGDHASGWPLNLREEEDALNQRTVPGTVGSVVDELVALWTMLPVG